jgi:hypothetical protein
MIFCFPSLCHDIGFSKCSCSRRFSSHDSKFFSWRLLEIANQKLMQSCNPHSSNSHQWFEFAFLVPKYYLFREELDQPSSNPSYTYMCTVLRWYVSICAGCVQHQWMVPFTFHNAEAISLLPQSQFHQNQCANYLSVNRTPSNLSSV